jgi:hypothetical protein
MAFDVPSSMYSRTSQTITRCGSADKNRIARAFRNFYNQSATPSKPQTSKNIVHQVIIFQEKH